MDAMKIANSIPMWLACALPVAFVILQAVLFARGAYKSGKKLGLNDKQMKKAMKSSAVTSIGPSIVVLSAMLSLLVSVGGPIGWMRLSMIGSVMFESIAAGLGTSAVGVQLGTDTLTPEALGMAVSIVINVSVLTIGAILGTSVLSMLPDTIKAALNYLLPALFGALLVQFGMKMKKHSVIMVVFAIILYFMIGMGYFNWLPGASNWLGTLGCVFVSIAVGMATLKNTTKE